jgi:TatD DNase family protein
MLTANSTKYINFHCHIRTEKEYALQPTSERGSGLSSLFNKHIIINNPLDKTEMETYLKIIENKKNKLINNMLISTGQHPLYPTNSVNIDDMIELLEQKKLFAIGEIGLDKRNPDLNSQEKVLIEFLDLAIQYHKPVIIHCVGHYYELHKLLKQQFPKLIYIIHSFNGSLEIIEKFKDLNIIFSLHPSILKIKNYIIVLKEITDKYRYCFETDEGFNGSHDVENVILQIAEFTGLNKNILINNQYNVYKELVAS